MHFRHTGCSIFITGKWENVNKNYFLDRDAVSFSGNEVRNNRLAVEHYDVNLLVVLYVCKAIHFFCKSVARERENMDVAFTLSHIRTPMLNIGKHFSLVFSEYPLLITDYC